MKNPKRTIKIKIVFLKQTRITVTMVIEKESKKRHSNDIIMRKKMVRLKRVYKGPKLDHNSQQKTITHNTPKEPTKLTNKTHEHKTIL